MNSLLTVGAAGAAVAVAAAAGAAAPVAVAGETSGFPSSKKQRTLRPITPHQGYCIHGEEPSDEIPSALWGGSSPTAPPPDVLRVHQMGAMLKLDELRSRLAKETADLRQLEKSFQRETLALSDVAVRSSLMGKIAEKQSQVRAIKLEIASHVRRFDEALAATQDPTLLNRVGVWMRIMSE